MSALLEQLRRGIVTRSAAETQEIAEKLSGVLPEDVVLALHGDLGVGKTTLVQGLARGFGIQEPVTSPTFNIYTVHQPGAGAPRGRMLVHLDAYRLDHPGQMEALLLEDFLVSPWAIAVEWPEKIAAWIPPAALHLDLAITPETHHSIRLR